MKLSYLNHILLWMLPVVIGQWGIGGKILWRNHRAILFPVMIASLYLTFADSFAIRSGIWFFDPNQHLAWNIGPYVPVEEILFFAISSLMVSQSIILFLPDRFRA